MEKSVYVVLSQTGTMFSKALKFFTRAEYNHASISLTPTLDKMYSFGRLNPYNPFIGGFVEEGKNVGTFKRFYKTTAMVMEFKVSEEKYNAVKYFIEYFKTHKVDFHYNYLGVLFACFKRYHKSSKRFYCSEFVKTCLETFNIENAEELPKIIKPIDFLKLNNKNIIYKGFLKNYMSV
ncbi:MAG: hypothetical protein IJW32_04235 [Clostridia bacterium]|nr:hypothetical protein [Clostridia bacterium]